MIMWQRNVFCFNHLLADSSLSLVATCHSLQVQHSPISQALLSPTVSQLPHTHTQAAGLGGLLQDRSAQNTFFAPSDDAFDNLQRQIGVSTPELLANTALVTQVDRCGGESQEC